MGLNASPKTTTHGTTGWRLKEPQQPYALDGDIAEFYPRVQLDLRSHSSIVSLPLPLSSPQAAEVAEDFVICDRRSKKDVDDTAPPEAPPAGIR